MFILHHQRDVRYHCGVLVVVAKEFGSKEGSESSSSFVWYSFLYVQIQLRRNRFSSCNLLILRNFGCRCCIIFFHIKLTPHCFDIFRRQNDCYLPSISPDSVFVSDGARRGISNFCENEGCIRTMLHQSRHFHFLYPKFYRPIQLWIAENQGDVPTQRIKNCCTQHSVKEHKFRWWHHRHLDCEF
jgi:hypothetical protein